MNFLIALFCLLISIEGFTESYYSDNRDPKRYKIDYRYINADYKNRNETKVGSLKNELTEKIFKTRGDARKNIFEYIEC